MALESDSIADRRGDRCRQMGSGLDPQRSKKRPQLMGSLPVIVCVKSDHKYHILTHYPAILSCPRAGWEGSELHVHDGFDIFVQHGPINGTGLISATYLDNSENYWPMVRSAALQTPNKLGSPR